eukprot:6074129-Ditylum_brightwellii.AAC.1
MDDLGVKVFSDSNANHLIETFKNYCKISVDCNGGNYCGLTIDWQYKDNYVDALMPSFVPTALTKLHHPTPKSHSMPPIVGLVPNMGKKYDMHHHQTTLNA